MCKRKFEMCIHVQMMSNRMSYRKLLFSNVGGPTLHGSIDHTSIPVPDTWRRSADHRNRHLDGYAVR